MKKTKAGKEEVFPVTVYLDRVTLDRVDAFAKRMGVSRSQLASLLLAFGTEGEIWTANRFVVWLTGRVFGVKELRFNEGDVVAHDAGADGKGES